MWGGYYVYILFCAISCEPPPIPGVTWNIHTFNVKDLCYLQDTCVHAACVHVCGIHQVNREKTRCQLQKRSCLVGGRASQASSQLELQADNALFSKHSGKRASGSGYLKHLAPFISPPGKWIRTLKCQSKWSHLVSSGRSLHFSRSQTGRKSEGPAEDVLSSN